MPLFVFKSTLVQYTGADILVVLIAAAIAAYWYSFQDLSLNEHILVITLVICVVLL